MDIVRGRVDSPEPPSWCEARGWTDFLLGLSEEELALCEGEGLGAFLEQAAGTRAPAELCALAKDALRCSVFARAPNAFRELSDTRHIALRKQFQLQALLDAIEPMAKRAGRLLDVGAGRGHFTRLAANLFECDTLGLEREPMRVGAAQRLAQNSSAHFKAFDAVREEFSPEADDLIIGLHACGDLGDRIVLASSKAPCDLVLVSCCLQKIDSEEREPLSDIGKKYGFRPRREDLGLSNLKARWMGVETGLLETLKARETRYALRLLLNGRGICVEAGEEMRGLNRRLSHKGLKSLAERALSLRALESAGEEELRHCEERASAAYQYMRRLSLPRAMLARLLEAAVVLDRAQALLEKGHRVRVEQLFDDDISPRNLGIFAEARRA